MGDTFEAPIGYWSTRVDDWPALDETTFDEDDNSPPGPQPRAAFLGATQDSTLIWQQCLHEGEREVMRFMTCVR